MSDDEQNRRNLYNIVFDEMRKRGAFKSNDLMQYFLMQTDFETCGGYVLTYDEALNYYNEIVETYN